MATGGNTIVWLRMSVVNNNRHHSIKALIISYTALATVKSA